MNLVAAIMGNTPSVEVPRTGAKTTQKLSKPRIGNPSTAGLLNPNGLSERLNITPSARRRRRRCSSSLASLTSPDPGIPPVEDLDFSERNSTLPDLLVGPYLHSEPPTTVQTQRSRSIELSSRPNRGRRMSTTCASYIGPDENGQPEFGLTGTSLRSASRSSLNNEHDAKRLSSFVEEPVFEDYSMTPESQFRAAVSRRESLSSYYHPVHNNTQAGLSRTSSDISLYTPMRRRSLLTPGLATRPPPADLSASSKTQSRHSLPATCARCESLGAVGAELLTVPQPLFNISSTDRPLTPCDSEYKQTGAFKHGTLRITNGSPSPARTPAPEMTSNKPCGNGSQATEVQDGFFRTGVQEPQKRCSGNTGAFIGNQSIAPNSLETSASSAILDDVVTSTGERGLLAEFLPELRLTVTPISLGDLEPKLPELPITNQHTVVEDLLSEEISQEGIPETLNVPMDFDAKPNPNDRKAASEKELNEANRSGINRSDSAVVVSPRPRGPQTALSKADSGYGSSVSARSFPLKRNCLGGDNGTQSIEVVSPDPATSEHAGSSKRAARSPQPVSNDGPPPPVAEKDQYTKVLRREAGSNDSSGPSTLSGGLLTGTALAWATSEHSYPTSPGGVGLSTATANLSITSAPQKGRIQRLLSGSRAPLAAQATHPSDQDNDIPPVPRAAKAKLHERTAASPAHSENPSSGPKSQPCLPESTISVKTTVVEQRVTAEASVDSTAGGTDQKRTLNRKTSFHLQAIGSTISRAASSVMSRNPITWKKPLPRKAVREPLDAPTNSGPDCDAEMGLGREGGRTMTLDAVATQDEGERYRRYSHTIDRSDSLPTSISRPSSVAYYDAPRDSSSYRNEQRINGMHGLPMANQYMVSKTPPPISMRTRNFGYVRVPPPTRPRSTPPARPVVTTVTRKPSREDIQSCTDTSRRSSLESARTYSTTLTRESMSMKPRSSISNTIRAPGYAPQSGEYSAQNGSLRPQHSTRQSQRRSYDYSRHSSMVSHTSQRSASSSMQALPQASIQDQPRLQHRSSYDGPSLQMQMQQPYGGQSYLPHMDNYLRSLSTSQPERPYQVKPHSVSQSHHPHGSFDQYRPAPYRVLHSYNSPSYRHAPIWSN